jgi:hypothetical protein
VEEPCLGEYRANAFEVMAVASHPFAHTSEQDGQALNPGLPAAGPAMGLTNSPECRELAGHLWRMRPADLGDEHHQEACGHGRENSYQQKVGSHLRSEC